MTKTTVLKPAEVSRKWIEIDASEAPLGRIATLAAQRLTGKYQAAYTPHVDSGDYVIITNADKLVLTGRKAMQKTYYRHSGYMGSTKQATAEELIEKDSTKVINSAIKGMLPKNKLQANRMNRLKVFKGSDHPHNPQQPAKIGVKNG